MQRNFKKLKNKLFELYLIVFFRISIKNRKVYLQKRTWLIVLLSPILLIPTLSLGILAIILSFFYNAGTNYEKCLTLKDGFDGKFNSSDIMKIKKGLYYDCEAI